MVVDLRQQPNNPRVLQQEEVEEEEGEERETFIHSFIHFYSHRSKKVCRKWSSCSSRSHNALLLNNDDSLLVLFSFV